MTPLKITFANAIRKLNFYIRNRPQDYECLKQQLDYHLFGRRNLPKCELELYWIVTITLCSNINVERKATFLPYQKL
ncbi:uncharacterized protein LOC128863764 isoform X2 [Anastrepha ludens]|uniref:uncharacterized protein LOC128863764 isoform X2 n=1 Tax=Anastrepha ludens TaxID=28586 RepID=UPI0023B145FB|nr:uncharacterized protein LOC128863764 isoform X2 [Anastrepha ludens]